MAFYVKKSDGSTLAIVSSNSVNTTSSSITLHGRGKLRWGNAVNENFVHILENFAGGSPPLHPLVGQLWFDTSNINASPQGTGTLNFWSESGSPVTGQWVNLLTASESTDLFVNVSGDTMFGDLQFNIPIGTYPPTESKGILWTGNTDKARLYVEEESIGSPISTEYSKFIIQIEDDVAADEIKLRHRNTVASPNVDLDMISSGTINTTIRGTSDNILKLHTFNDGYSKSGFGYIGLYTNDETGSPITDEETARIGFVNYGSNDNKNDFTIDNRRGGGPGITSKVFRYSEDGQTILRVGGSTELAYYHESGAGSPQYTGVPAFQVAVGGFDMTLGGNDQVTRGDSGSSRAIVKEVGPILCINFDNDYGSGVRVGGPVTRSDLEITGELRVATSVPTASAGNGNIYIGNTASDNDIEFGSKNASISIISFYNRTTASNMDFVARKGNFSGTGGISIDASYVSGTQRIVHVATPVASTDAANKDYVDDKVLVTSGTVADGGVVGGLVGYINYFIVAAGRWNNFGGIGSDGIDAFHAYASSPITGSGVSTVVNCYTTNGPTFTGTAVFMRVSIKI